MAMLSGFRSSHRSVRGTSEESYGYYDWDGYWHERKAPKSFLGNVRKEYMDIVDQEPIYEIW